MSDSRAKLLVDMTQDRHMGSDRRRITCDYPSAFVAQVLNTRSTEPLRFKPARNTALEAYAHTAGSATKRAPAGLSHTSSI